MNDERRKYLYEYRKSKLKRITLDVPPDFYEQFKAIADEEQKPVGTLIKFLMTSYVEHKCKHK